MTVFLFEVLRELGYIKSWTSGCYYKIFVIYEDGDEKNDNQVHIHYLMVDSLANALHKKELKPSYLSADEYSRNNSYNDIVEKIGPGKLYLNRRDTINSEGTDILRKILVIYSYYVERANL